MGGRDLSLENEEIRSVQNPRITEVGRDARGPRPSYLPRMGSARSGY